MDLKDIQNLTKRRESSGSHKKVFVETFDGRTLPGYVTPALMDRPEGLELMSLNGEVAQVDLEHVRAVYFVNDFEQKFLPARKSFLSRPKLDGLWVRVKYRDDDTLEGVVSNDLLALLDRGVHLIPPDPGTNCTRMFIPRPAIAEMTVLGVVGIARRTPAKRVAEPQPTLFNE
jgi:hypothetical protein